MVDIADHLKDITDSTGERIWSELTAFREAGAGRRGVRRIGTLKVDGLLRIGDGCTFVCDQEAPVKPDTWALYRIETRALGAVVAAREAAHPTLWFRGGGITTDTSVGAFIPGAASKVLERLRDPDVYVANVVDNALWMEGRREAVVPVRGRLSMAVFDVGRRGSFEVVMGLKEGEGVCAAAVVLWESDGAGTAALPRSGRGAR